MCLIWFFSKMHLFTFAHITVNSVTLLQPAPTSPKSCSVLMIPWVCSPWGGEQNLIASGTAACPAQSVWHGTLNVLKRFEWSGVWSLRACEIAEIQWHCEAFDFRGNPLVLSCNFWTSIPLLKTEFPHLFHLNTLREQLFCWVVNVTILCVCTLYSL